MIDEKDIINRIKAGDAPASRILIETYKRLVYNTVFRMIGNETEREDVCQDIFIKVFENLAKFKFDSKLSTWIARIAINTCINTLKKKKLLLVNDITDGENSFEYTLQAKTSTDQYAEEQDLSTRLHNEINRLPRQFRLILTLFHLEEMSYSEIAEILNLPEGTVKSYLFRARRLLKDRLSEKYQQEDLWHANI